MFPHLVKKDMQCECWQVAKPWLYSSLLSTDKTSFRTKVSSFLFSFFFLVTKEGLKNEKLKRMKLQKLAIIFGCLQILLRLLHYGEIIVGDALIIIKQK